MSETTGSRPRRSSAGQPPAWYKPQDAPLRPAERPPRVADRLQGPPPAAPSGPLPQAWPPRGEIDAWAPAPAQQRPMPTAHVPHEVAPPGSFQQSPFQPSPFPPSQASPFQPSPSGPADAPHRGAEPPKASPLARNRWLGRVFGHDAAVTEEDDLLDDWDTMLEVLDAPVAQHRITVSSLRARSGKTTTLLGLGTALALHRRELVTSLDAHPFGMLADRVGPEHGATVSDLLRTMASIHTASDLRRFTSMARSRLEVLASSRTQPLGPGDYAAALQVLLTFRPIVLTDTTSDLSAAVMPDIFGLTDSLVVPLPLDEEGIRSAVETLAWWERRSPLGPGIVGRTVIALGRGAFVPDPHRHLRGRELRRMEDEFEAMQDALEDEALRVLGPRVAGVVSVPSDPALEVPGLFLWDELQPETQDAYINVAYEVARLFPS